MVRFGYPLRERLASESCSLTAVRVISTMTSSRRSVSALPERVTLPSRCTDGITGRSIGFHNFEPSAMDHKYMVDLLASRGAEAVVLAGHSYGTVTIPYYVATSNDPRVKA